MVHRAYFGYQHPLPVRRAVALSLTIIGGAWLAGCSVPPAMPSNAASQELSASKLEPGDIDRLAGAPWIGTLTYKDYSSGRPTTIDSSFMVSRVPGEPAAWKFGYGYSKEPHADAEEVVRLSSDGRVLGDERVVAVERGADGSLRFTTESEGDDDGRPSLFRFEHVSTPTTLTRRKLVRFEGESEFFERHIYRWAR